MSPCSKLSVCVYVCWMNEMWQVAKGKSTQGRNWNGGAIWFQQLRGHHELELDVDSKGTLGDLGFDGTFKSDV